MIDTQSSTAPSVDPAHFRKVLSAYPTGVCVITAVRDGIRLGLAVGSFTSISLNPPLVGFLPGKTSTSWRSIAETGRFCVNVLGTHQSDICQRFAMKSDDKFGELSHGFSPAGLPLIDEAIGWIDCRIHSIQEIGDHYLVVGAVEDLGCTDVGPPLIFFRGGYHDVVSLSRD